MSIKTYDIPYFSGINQAGGENSLPARFAIDAVNMDTDGGCLRVADGFYKLNAIPVPGNGRIELLSSLKNASGEIPVVMTGGKLYALISNSWTLMHTASRQNANVTCDATMVRIGSTDCLVIADGQNQLIKFDGESVTAFGSAEGCSDMPVSFLAMYRGRLFAAGDPENPDRLYYSVLPGSGRTVEDWGYVEASPAVEGGHTEVGSIGGDPIVAIKALSNQLLIFKKNSLYRLIGDRPSNYTIEHIDADMPTTRHTSIAVYGDVLYFVTRDGLYYYNGVTVRPCPDMRFIKNTMARAELAKCRAVIVGGKLYFNYTSGMDDEMMVYDLEERKYMRRNGFEISDLAAIGGKLIMINRRRLLYEFGKSSSYDGEPIEAYWRTPRTDLGDKAAIKSPKMLYLRGRGDGIRVEVELDGKKIDYYARLPSDGETNVTELPVFNEGRCLSLTFSNMNGGFFELAGGVELEMGVRRRTE
jgi:hypothetical protein